MLAVIVGLFDMFMQFLGNVLPESPFSDIALADGVGNMLGWLNWLVPVGQMVTLMGVVLGILIVAKVAQFILSKATSISKLATGGK